MFEAKFETTRQRILRQRADAILEKQYGTREKGFDKRQIKERNRRFFASQEWFDFRVTTLEKHNHACTKCGRRCGLDNVRLVMSIWTHFHLRLNPINVTVKCFGECVRKRKRERL